MAKSTSGNITVSRQVGGPPNAGVSVKRPSGGGKTSYTITVDRTVRKPPTRKPAQ